MVQGCKSGKWQKPKSLLSLFLMVLPLQQFGDIADQKITVENKKKWTITVQGVVEDSCNYDFMVLVWNQPETQTSLHHITSSYKALQFCRDSSYFFRHGRHVRFQTDMRINHTSSKTEGFRGFIFGEDPLQPKSNQPALSPAGCFFGVFFSPLGPQSVQPGCHVRKPVSPFCQGAPLFAGLPFRPTKTGG